MSDHAIAVSSVPPWRRLMGAWRRSKAQHGAAASGDALASALGIIQAERERWAGTQRTICTEAELEERFFIRNEIGRGSYGTVYRAIRVADAEELAVKVIDHSGLEDVRAQTIRECALWQEICSPYHPSILPLIEVVEVVGTSTLHLFTEVMSWGTLAEAIHDEDVDTSEASARLMVIQIASAVAHLHTVHAVAHRDIKPENVLCAESDPTLPGCLKLCDFGCCRRFTNVREAEFEDVLGTINYVAPELAAGFLAASASEPRHCGPAADCWALGAVCYEILHGAPPFADAKKYPSDEEKLMAIASPLPDGGPVSYPEASFGHISEAGRAFLRRLLTRAHAERATIEEALAMAWLQPVNDKAARDAMAAAAPSRPEAATTARPTGRLRTAVRRLMLANRWIGGSSTAPVPDGQLSARSARRPPAVVVPDGGGEQQPALASSFSASFKRADAQREAAATSPGGGSVLGSLSFKRAGVALADSFKRRPGGPPLGVGAEQSGSSFRNKWKADAAATHTADALDVVGVDPILHYTAIYATSPQAQRGANAARVASPRAATPRGESPPSVAVDEATLVVDADDVLLQA